MTRLARLFAMGICVGIAITTIGAVEVGRIQANISRLVASCEEEDRGELPPGVVPLCDPRELEASDAKQRRRYEGALGTSQVVEYRPPRGVQGDLVAAQRRLEAWQSKPPRIAIAVIIVTGLPWVWYFLLDRIREVSKAIQGE